MIISNLIFLFLTLLSFFARFLLQSTNSLWETSSFSSSPFYGHSILKQTVDFEQKHLEQSESLDLDLQTFVHMLTSFETFGLVYYEQTLP